MWLHQVWISVVTILITITLRNLLPALLRKFPQDSNLAKKYPAVYARFQSLYQFATDEKKRNKVMAYASLFMAFCFFFLSWNVFHLIAIVKCTHALIKKED